MPIQWDRDESLTVGRTHVEVLQRRLALAIEILREELRPAFELQTLFEHRNHDTAAIVRMRAVLHALEVNDAVLTFRLQRPDSKDLSVLSLMAVTRGTITVWRIDDTLDALQFLFEAGSEEMYIQLGGVALARLVQEASETDAVDSLLDIFTAAGHLPPNRRQ